MITIPFRSNVVVTEALMASALEPEHRVYATWDNAGEEAVHVTLAGHNVGTGVYIAAGQRLVIADDGSLRVEGIGHA